ncbi:MAG: DUF58 domain-containing protein [Roseiflexaceae bacterium]|nr:DUF58 domain-containing protein [Roseiflexaceae bacterium]
MTTATPQLFDAAFVRKLDRMSLLMKRAMAGDLQGERRSPRRGSSVEFSDYRHYTSGDDFRQIDWNMYARMERFFLKLFVAEEELTVHLLIDNTASMDWGEPNKLQYARRTAGALGYIALASLDRVTVTAFANEGGKQLPGVRGRRGAIPLFDFLQKLPAGRGGSFVESCRRYARTARNAGPLILCSDLMDTQWEEALRALTVRPFEITLIHTLAPQEIRPQLDGDFRLVDAEGGDPIEITADLESLRRYEQNLQQWRGEIESFCSGRGITYLFADTSSPVEEFVLSTLRRRGVLR